MKNFHACLRPQKFNPRKFCLDEELDQQKFFGFGNTTRYKQGQEQDKIPSRQGQDREQDTDKNKKKTRYRARQDKT